MDDEKKLHVTSLSYLRLRDLLRALGEVVGEWNVSDITIKRGDDSWWEANVYYYFGGEE